MRHPGKTFLLSAATAGLIFIPAYSASAADEASKAAESPSQRPDNMPAGTDNTRTGSDNTNPTSADSARRAVAPPTAEAPERTTAAETAAVVAQLHQVNQLEVEAGKMAGEKASSPAVARYGARLVRDHRAADGKLLAYAKKRGMDLTSQPAAAADEDPDLVRQRAAVEKLQTLSGGEFDREFLKVMEEGHRKTLERVSSARASATDPQLKALLGQMIPSLEKHHDTSTSLMESGAGAGAGTGSRTDPGTSGQRPRAVDGRTR